MTGKNMSNTIYPVVLRAIDIVKNELEIITAEREALSDFRGRISVISADDGHQLDTRIGSTSQRIVDPAEPSASLQAVRAAYRDTVMDVPHYESEYNEPFEEHVSTEFSQTIANNLINGELLTAPLHSALIKAVEQRTATRDAFRKELRQERQSLELVNDSLGDIESQTHQISSQLERVTGLEQRKSLRDELRRLETECGQLADSRQATIHQRSQRDWEGIASGSLPVYLYGELETPTPALQAIGSCIESIHENLRRCRV